MFRAGLSWNLARGLSPNIKTISFAIAACLMGFNASIAFVCIRATMNTIRETSLRLHYEQAQQCDSHCLQVEALRVPCFRPVDAYPVLYSISLIADLVLLAHLCQRRFAKGEIEVTVIQGSPLCSCTNTRVPS